MQIVDPRTGATAVLNEYEVSLARMLNGKRPVFEVLEASDRLGIPINVESLQKFIDALEAQGLVQPAESLDSAVENAWPSRGQWDSNIRTLFQTGIRFLRQGKHAEAMSYFETLIAEDPENVEAKELLEMCKQALAAPVQTVVVPPPSSSFAIPGHPQMTPSGPVPVVAPMHGGSPHTPPHGYAMQPMMPGEYPVQPMAMPMASAPVAPYPYYPGQPYPQQPGAFAPAPAPAAGLKMKWVIPGLAALVGLGAVLGFFVLRKDDPATQQESVASKSSVETGVVTNQGSGRETGSAEPTKVDSPVTMTAGSGSSVGSGSAAVAPTDVDASGNDAAASGSAQSDETDAATTDVAKPDAATTDAGTETAKPATNKTGTSKTGGSKTGAKNGTSATPAGKPEDISAPMAGDVTAYLKSPRVVKKGAKLFLITKVTGDPDKIKELTAKVAEMTKLAKEDDVYKAFLANAKKDLSRARTVSKTVVTAPKAGKATPKVKNGSTVRSGQVMAVIQ